MADYITIETYRCCDTLQGAQVKTKDEFDAVCSECGKVHRLGKRPFYPVAGVVRNIGPSEVMTEYRAVGDQ